MTEIRNPPRARHLRTPRTMWGWKTILAVSLGASLGALLRLLLSESLNATFPAIPPGTLLSNLIGGYIVGVAIAFFATDLAEAETLWADGPELSGICHVSDIWERATGNGSKGDGSDLCWGAAGTHWMAP